MLAACLSVDLDLRRSTLTRSLKCGSGYAWGLSDVYLSFGESQECQTSAGQITNLMRITSCRSNFEPKSRVLGTCGFVET